MSQSQSRHWLQHGQHNAAHAPPPTTEGVAMMPAAMDSLLRSPPDRPLRSSPPGSWPPTCRSHAQQVLGSPHVVQFGAS